MRGVVYPRIHGNNLVFMAKCKFLNSGYWQEPAGTNLICCPGSFKLASTISVTYKWYVRSPWIGAVFADPAEMSIADRFAAILF
jgi:hypothetical protein